MSGEWRATGFGVMDWGWIVTDRAQGPLPPPMFFVSADSKGFTWEVLVNADSAGVKVAVFSMSWGRRVSADSKGVMGAICL
jgi:hypothetical protein